MKTNFDDIVNKTNIRAFVKLDDLVKGKRYDEDKIELMYQEDINRNTLYHFEVDSESKNTYYDVVIAIFNNENISRCICDCKQYRQTRSCKHIAACLYYYKDLLFEKKVFDVSDLILESFIEEKSVIKKELNLQLNIEIKEYENSYYFYSYKEVVPKLLIGFDKFYTMGNHLNNFMSAYEQKDGEVYFGKSFTYDASVYYLSEENEKVLYAYQEFVNNNSYYRNSSSLKKLFSKLKKNSFIINNYKVNGIIENFPIDTNLSKINDDYVLNFDLDKIETILDDDYEYILYKGKLYHLTHKEQKIIEDLNSSGTDNITITKDKFSLFTKGLLSVIKKNLNVDASVDDIVIPKDINTKLYFDLRNKYILANPVFIYDDVEVNYFSNKVDVLRDTNYETKVINDILKYGFIIDKEKIVLEDLEEQVEFIENGLENLANEYEIFTTEKFKNVNIKKKTNISSMFKIGQDNIMGYNFELGDINSDELVNIFNDLKSKKKYYRLKNGDILNLEDEALKELSELSSDLELSDEDIIRGNGSILKYRAIYLDSLKNTKYNIIKTDNLFDDFINKFYKYKDAKLTLDDISVLRDYQVTGVKWLYNLDKTGFGGILADEMGLGKTIQVIYYIKQVLKDDENAKFLIVVPTSLAYNWYHEFEMYAPNLKVIVNDGVKTNRKKVLEKLNDYNCIVTTYGKLREDGDIYNDYHFHAIVIDEAQNIKNTLAGVTKSVKNINADTKIALTGTPLENSVLELWSIFDFVMPGYLSSLTKFQSKYRIKDFDEETDELIKGLSKQINPFILRRKKEDVIKELPDKMINDVYVDLKDEQKKLYVAELERVKKEMNEIIENEGISKARFLILQLLTKLRQICIDPKIIYDNYNDGSNKLDHLETLVNEYIKNNHKVLIFSSFKTGLNIVKERLDKMKIKSYMIDGSVSSKKRIEMVDDFNQNDDVKVFLIMLKSGGTGLNLTSADVVIHLDLWWNPQAENQATDRAHRIGQKNVVEVVHIVTKGTIEEKILELQNKKKILSDKLIDGDKRDKNILGSLTKEDIKNLLAYENKD